MLLLRSEWTDGTRLLNIEEMIMNIDKLITIQVTLAFLAVGTGQLPKILKEVRIAQLKILRDSQASQWGTPMLPPSN